MLRAIRYYRARRTRPNPAGHDPPPVQSPRLLQVESTQELERPLLDEDEDEDKAPGARPRSATSTAREAAWLLRLSLGAGQCTLAVSASVVLVAISMNPKAQGVQPFLYLLTAVVVVYYVVLERHGRRAAARVIPAGQVFAAICMAAAAAFAPLPLATRILASEQDAVADPYRWLGNPLGGILLGSQEIPLRTKLGSASIAGILYSGGLFICAYRAGASASTAVSPILAEASLFALGLWAALATRISRCAPVIDQLESDAQKEAEAKAQPPPPLNTGASSHDTAASSYSPPDVITGSLRGSLEGPSTSSGKTPELPSTPITQRDHGLDLNGGSESNGGGGSRLPGWTAGLDGSTVRLDDSRSDSDDSGGRAEATPTRVEQINDEKERLNWELQFAERSLLRLERANVALARQLSQRSSWPEPHQADLAGGSISHSSSSEREGSAWVDMPAPAQLSDSDCVSYNSYNTTKLPGAQYVES